MEEPEVCAYCLCKISSVSHVHRIQEPAATEATAKPAEAEAPAPAEAAAEAAAEPAGEAGPAPEASKEAEAAAEAPAEAASSSSKELQIGDVLPSITLSNNSGTDVDIGSLAKDQGVVFFLVPKANTREQ